MRRRFRIRRNPSSSKLSYPHKVPEGCRQDGIPPAAQTVENKNAKGGTEMHHAGGVPAGTTNSDLLQEPRSTRSSRLLRLAWMLTICVTLVGASGCTALQGVRDVVQYNDMCDDFVIGWRNYVWANQAWHSVKPTYAGQPYVKDFGEGFRAGYCEVAAGGNGCPPPLPPRKYWSWKYQSPEGQAKVAAWFAGYPHGAATAEQECAGNWRQIQVSHVMEQQYSPEFDQARIPRADGTPYPQPTEGVMPDPRNWPSAIPPESSGIGPRAPPNFPPNREYGPAFEERTTQNTFLRSHVAANAVRTVPESRWISDRPREGRFGGRRLPPSSESIPRPDERADSSALIAR